MRRSLRRYRSSDKARCPEHPLGYHNAQMVIEPEAPLDPDKDATRCFLPEEYEGDPRWPKSCVCGYRFVEDDNWQVFTEGLYKGAADGKLYGLRDRDLPVGAAWDAHWMPESYCGPDGKRWAIRLPCGYEWLVYGPSSNGGNWTVEGQMPRITVSPSIHMVGAYHGFIRDGVISEDCDGRAFEDLPRTA